MNELRNAKRIVVKIGTNSVIQNGKLNTVFLKDLTKAISLLGKKGKEFVLVSSGAVGCGAIKLGINKNNYSVLEQQVCAAVGQSVLMHNYKELFKKQNQLIAQILLTQDNFKNKKILGNLNATINGLLSSKVVPIVNENDSIAIEELASEKVFSDNDLLAALLAVEMKADLLIILSSVAGLHSDDPNKNKKAKRIARVNGITKQIERIAGIASIGGKGGMNSKIKAAKICRQNRIRMIIAKSEKQAIQKILENKTNGTIFY